MDSSAADFERENAKPAPANPIDRANFIIEKLRENMGFTSCLPILGPGVISRGLTHA